MAEGRARNRSGIRRNLYGRTINGIGSTFMPTSDLLSKGIDGKLCGGILVLGKTRHAGRTFSILKRVSRTSLFETRFGCDCPIVRSAIVGSVVFPNSATNSTNRHTIFFSEYNLILQHFETVYDRARGDRLSQDRAHVGEQPCKIWLRTCVLSLLFLGSGGRLIGFGVRVYLPDA